MNINEKHKLLLGRIKEKLIDLEFLHFKLSNEDMPYRFYHQSFKVYKSQDVLREVQKLFEEIAKDEFAINDYWTSILEKALIGPFNMSHNEFWLKKTQPQIEAWFHAKYFVEMMIKYGLSFKEPPEILPAGWASVLYLFNVR